MPRKDGRSELVQCGALWLKKTQQGKSFLSGILKGPYQQHDSPLGLENDVSILIFPNNYKSDNPKSPTHLMFTPVDNDYQKRNDDMGFGGGGDPDEDNSGDNDIPF